MINNWLFVFILVNLAFLFMEAQEIRQIEKPDRSFLQSTIQLDNSSLQKIVLHPESILEDPEAFWQNDPAYQLYQQWHQMVGAPVDMEQWTKGLQLFVETPQEERPQNAQLLLSQKAMNPEKIKAFNDRAIPFLYAFLPENTPSITTTIYFTTAIQSNGFQMNNDVVIYGENADKENLFIHELFHRCQRALSPISERNPEFQALDQLYLLLWAEGTATYVAQQALKEFPTVDPLLQRDYQLLQDSTSTDRLREKLNELYQSAALNTIDQKILLGQFIQIGVMQRAFYMVGYHMAATIDGQLGRDTFKKALLHGPKYFIEQYNAVVEEEEQVVDLYFITASKE